MNTATNLRAEFSRLYATLDHCLISVQDEIERVLKQQELPEALPADHHELAERSDWLHQLISLHCLCDVVHRDLGDGGIDDMPETYETFRTEVLPKLRGNA